MAGCFGRLLNAVWFALAAAALGVPGAPVFAQSNWSFSLDRGRHWFHEGALNSLATAFFAGDNVAAAVGRIEPQHNVAVSLRWTDRLAMTDVTSIVSGVQVQFGQAEYFLPEGARPFIDPITTRFQFVVVTPTIGVQGQFELLDFGDVFGQAGFGADYVYSRNRLTSALLNVHSKDTFSTPYLFIGGGWQGRGQLDGIALEGRAQFASDYPPDVTVSLLYQF